MIGFIILLSLTITSIIYVMTIATPISVPIVIPSLISLLWLAMLYYGIIKTGEQLERKLNMIIARLDILLNKEGDE